MAKKAKNNNNNSKKRRSSEQHKAKAKEQLEAEIASLTARVQDEAPARGYAPPVHQTVAFRALPLSQKTLRGLEDTSTSSSQEPFTTMTAIQNACLPHALAGRDILGAARTGSGKTLAFLLPVLECLFRNRFTPAAGPGAAILSPTRELAVQIFQVLRRVGKFHSFSVGLLMGGKKDFWEEQQSVGTTNIIIATPGRLLQHLEQTPYFEMSNLQILVLDEADRILDMGFRDQLVNILQYLPTPPQRQTLLFSATQTRDVSALATLSLHRPEYLGVHDQEATATPAALQQSYIVVPLEHKLNAVYSFLKTHLRCKSIVFLASCAQVRHAWQLFCSLRPGLPVLALHGKLVQSKRTQIYLDFVQRQRHGVLFATDICSRGLDFPNIDWVVQADAPEDKAMYIHRVGRTARYRKGGKSLLILTPAEEKGGFIQMLQGRAGKKGGKSTTTTTETSKNTVPIKKLSINPTKTVVVTQRAASLVAANPDLNRLAKKAFQSYVRCIYLMPLKDIFNVQNLPLQDYSASLGLASKPNLRFLKECEQDRSERRAKKNVNKKLQKLKEQIKAEKLAKKLEKLGQTADDENNAQQDESNNDDSGDELLVSKKKHNWNEKDDNGDNGAVDDVVGLGGVDDVDDADVGVDAGVHQVTQSRRPKKIRIEGTNANNTHVTFTDDGQVENVKRFMEDTNDTILKDKQELSKATDEYMTRVRNRLQANLDEDRADEKERVRLKHKKRRLEEKAEREGGQQQQQDGPVIVTLGGFGSDGEHDNGDMNDDRVQNENRDEVSDDDESASSFSGSSSTSSSSDESEMDVKAREDLALSLIRSGAT